jgi:hypothetical protein
MGKKTYFVIGNGSEKAWPDRVINKYNVINKYSFILCQIAGFMIPRNKHLVLQSYILPMSFLLMLSKEIHVPGRFVGRFELIMTNKMQLKIPNSYKITVILLKVLLQDNVDTYEPRHYKTNIMCLRPALIQTSLRICAVCSGSMLFAYKPYNK